MERLLRAALVNSDVEAFQRLKSLCEDDPQLFQKTIPTIVRHLKTPNPSTQKAIQDNAPPHRSERLAIIALELVPLGDKHSDDDDSSFKRTWRAHTTDILRWTKHLLLRWVIDIDEPLRTLESGTMQELYNTVSAVVPRALIALAYAGGDSLRVMRNDVDVGWMVASLCVQVFLPSNRDLHAHHDDHDDHDDHPFIDSAALHLHGLMATYQNDLTQEINHWGWERTLLQTIEQKAPILIMLFRSSLAAYSCQKLVFTAYLEHRIALIITQLVCRLSFSLDSPPVEDHPDICRIIGWLACFLLTYLEKGGPPVTVCAIRNGLFDVLLRINEVTVVISEIKQEQEMVQKFSEIVDWLTRLVVYPQVLKAMDGFLDRFADVEEMTSCGLCEKLNLLADRVAEETDVIRGLKRVQRGFSCFPSPYKFCDNSRCPTASYIVQQLWRCAGCRAGYYCSRYCQRIVWNDGHRDECKILVQSRDAGKNGYPPLNTIHDLEFFRKTAFARLRYFAEPFRGRVPLDTAGDCEVHLDLTRCPVDLTSSPREKPGRIFRATFPTCDEERAVSFVFPLPNSELYECIEDQKGWGAECE